MKKLPALVYAVVLGIFVPTVVYGNAQFRMALSTGTDFVDRLSFENVSESFNDPTKLFEGAKIEIITSQIVGFGVNGLIRFTEEEFIPGADEGWLFDWNGDVFLSAHLFGGGSLVDPFLEVGYGCVGRVRSAPSLSGEWTQGTDGLWLYRFFDKSTDRVTNLSLFPVVSAGVAFDLKGFLIGAKISYRPIVHEIPTASIDAYPLTQLHIGLFGGVALGGHR